MYIGTPKVGAPIQSVQLGRVASPNNQIKTKGEFTQGTCTQQNVPWQDSQSTLTKSNFSTLFE